MNALNKERDQDQENGCKNIIKKNWKKTNYKNKRSNSKEVINRK